MNKSTKQAIAVYNFNRGCSVQQIADQLAVSRHTVSRWLQDMHLIVKRDKERLLGQIMSNVVNDNEVF